MVIGEKQALRRDERRGAIRKSNCRQSNMVEPGGGYFRSVNLLHGGRRKIIEGPHSLVGMRGCKRRARREQQKSTHRFLVLLSARRTASAPFYLIVGFRYNRRRDLRPKAFEKIAAKNRRLATASSRAPRLYFVRQSQFSDLPLWRQRGDDGGQ